MNRLGKEGIVLGRYAASGLVALAFELSLLYALLQFLSASHYISVAISFAVATALQYEACHWWVFGSSKRPARIEYAYFAAIMISGLLLTIGLVALFVNIFGIGVIVARTISGIFVGLWDFYLNARFNFRAHAFLRG